MGVTFLENSMHIITITQKTIYICKIGSALREAGFSGPGTTEQPASGSRPLHTTVADPNHMMP